MSKPSNRIYLWSILMGLVLTVALVFSVIPLRATRFAYLWLIVNERGVLQYLTWFTGLSVLSFAILAHLRGDLRKRLVGAIIIFSLFPLAPGYFVYRVGLAVVEQHYKTSMATNPSAEQIAQIEQTHAIGFATCLDALVVAAALTMICMVAAVFLWVRRGGENSWERQT